MSLEEQSPDTLKLLSDHLISSVEGDEMTAILKTQERMKTQLAQTNHHMESFNNFSAARYGDNLKSLEQYAKLLKDMKGDLETIFRRIRKIKDKMQAEYPTEWSTAASAISETQPAHEDA